MFERITQNWNIWRFLRLGIAIFLIIQGVIAQDWFLVFIAGFLLYQTIFNVGCSSGNCAIPEPKVKENDNELR